ncbi:hypothetical protein H5410_057657 [Solanum commersonii]|uniref:Uncharacterized protein n=1 Tax=Solanum commersonii TaxID=4109 RepID=A0A9J5WNH5_SOLCO|nr:hypothetical protein H5410_057657 [Solanum commersonii]
MVETLEKKGMGRAPSKMDRMGFWNSRGINRIDKQREMQLFLHNSSVSVSLFGFLETKIKRAQATRAALNLCAGWSFTTNLAEHLGCRIWLLWKPNVYKVDIKKVTAQMIHCEVLHLGIGKLFLITMVYGFNDQGMRRALWQDIIELNGQCNRAWAIMGDFNCVLHTNERIGNKVKMAEIKGFKMCMETCGMKDLKYSGAFYTWNNKESGAEKVYSKIDRVMVNCEWQDELPASEAHFIHEGLSDHSPAIIRWEDGSQRGKSRFKYYNMWSLAKEFKERVKESWIPRIQGRNMYRLVGKLNRLKKVLALLNRTTFSDVEVQTKEAWDVLIQCQDQIQKDPENAGLVEAEKRLVEDYKKKRVASAAFLKQKCKINWLKDGDMNTVFSQYDEDSEEC